MSQVSENGSIYELGEADFMVAAIFKIGPEGVQTVVRLPASDDNNFEPNCLFRCNDGSFYGTTLVEGTDSLGTVFKITP
jgi:uncharacterized repeat protein (TIGR03803 family)